MIRYTLTLIGILLTLAGIAQTPSSTPATPPYSDAIEVNGTLYISGQIGRLNGKLVTDSFEAEAHQVMKNVEQVLKKRNLSCDDLVNVTIYLKDMQQYSKLNEIYRTYFTGQKPLPARACVAVADMPLGASIQIAGIALIKK